MTTIFANAFWLFLGIVAGAFVQHFLNFLTTRRQASNALRVMQVEITYNLDEVDAFLRHVEWLKGRIAAGQIEEDKIFLPMHKFDYSTIGPLSNSGHFHMLLGADNLRKYLEFLYFFQSENASFLTQRLRLEHGVNNSMAYLDWIAEEAQSHYSKMRPLKDAKLTRFTKALVLGQEP
jgi:hypothetical protein